MKWIFYNTLINFIGGGIFYSSLKNDSNLTLQKCIVSSNNAIYGGGGARFFRMPFYYDNTSAFYNNSAYYAPNLVKTLLKKKIKIND